MDGSGEEALYVLKLKMLLFILQTHQQTCELWATIPAGTLPVLASKVSREKVPHPCKVELAVVQGQVHACRIYDAQRLHVMFEGKQALDRLEHCKELSWMVLPQHTHFSRHPFHWSHQEGNEVALLPQHSAQKQWLLCPPPRLAGVLEKRQIEHLPHKHRQVLLLVNGQRGMNDLCRMLTCSPDLLMTVFHDLEAQNLITFSDPDVTRSS